MSIYTHLKGKHVYTNVYIYLFNMYVSIQDLISLSLQCICIIATMSALCVYEQITFKSE